MPADRRRAGSPASKHTRRAVLAALLLACCALGCQTGASQEAHDTVADEAAIRALLEQQEQAWNRGDIEAFMEGYVRNDSLRFASGDTEHRGWQATNSNVPKTARRGFSRCSSRNGPKAGASSTITRQRVREFLVSRF